MYQYVLLAIVFAIIIYDITQLIRKGYQGTISWQVYVASCRYPIVPFLLGILFGHLFWPNDPGMAPITPGVIP